MGTDYYVRMVIGIPVQSLVEIEVTKVKRQHIVGNKPAYGADGNPLTFERYQTTYKWLPTSTTFSNEHDLENHLQSLGLSLCRWSNCGIHNDDIVGIPLYDDDSLSWDGRIGSYKKGLTEKEIEKAFSRAIEIFTEIGRYPTKVKLHSVVEFNC